MRQRMLVRRWVGVPGRQGHQASSTLRPLVISSHLLVSSQPVHMVPLSLRALLLLINHRLVILCLRRDLLRGRETILLGSL